MNKTNKKESSFYNFISWKIIDPLLYKISYIIADGFPGAFFRQSLFSLIIVVILFILVLKDTNPTRRLVEIILVAGLIIYETKMTLDSYKMMSYKKEKK